MLFQSLISVLLQIPNKGEKMEFDTIMETMSSFSKTSLDIALDYKWDKLKSAVSPQIKTPKLAIIAFQPGADNSGSLMASSILLKNNFIHIKQDDFRALHPNARYIKQRFGDENDIYSVLTNPFMKALSEQIIQKALYYEMNVCIERSMNAPKSIDKVIKKFKDYEISVFVSTCQKQLSQKACDENFKNQKSRWISKEYQNECMLGLGKTAAFVLRKYKDRINEFKVFLSRNSKAYKNIFDFREYRNSSYEQIAHNFLERTINKAIYSV